jgi:hypothetical protein
MINRKRCNQRRPNNTMINRKRCNQRRPNNTMINRKDVIREDHTIQ